MVECDKRLFNALLYLMLALTRGIVSEWKTCGFHIVFSFFCVK